ncbi:MAG: Xaa-Pro dipeptidase [Xanthomonadales bacterium]|nr:Xaa-Pro dipeptidase [Xanthomonadales bacterium]
MSAGKIISEGYKSHVAQLQRHWENALQAEGYDAALIHAGSKLVSFLDDYEYPFRCNPHLLWWLPLTHHHDSALLIRPGERPKLYYYQPDDYWYSPPADPESWWADEFEVVSVRDADAWKQAGINEHTAYIGDAPALAEAVNNSQLNPARLLNRIHLDRTRKTGYEVACMAEAARLGAVAHTAAEQAFREGLSEYDIHQRYCMSIQLVDAELPYGNIVALNEHGAVLHYQEHEQQVPDQVRSFLIDAGATVHGYACDITRTYATESGEFSELISAMDTMQQRLCAAVVEGLDYRDLHLRAHLDIAGILKDFDIIRPTAEDAVASGLSAVFYPHGLGHYLGLQTHDVAGLIADVEGTPIPRPEGHPFLRLTRTLEAGNVLTIEPGLYFIEPLLRKWREKGDVNAINWSKVEALAPYGGVRIEDDMVVTDGAPRNLTREAFAVP